MDKRTFLKSSTMLGIFISALIWGSHCFGQIDTSDIQLIKVAFNNEIDKKINAKEQIIYGDKVSGTDDFKKKISQGNVYKDMGNPSRTISLTDYERKFIIDQLEANKNFQWPENLFNNSKRVKSKDILTYARNIPTYDSLSKKKIIKGYVYVFSKPIYIRNRTVALMGFSRMCGGLCGEVDQAFYKLEKGKWCEFVSLSVGEF